MLHQALSNYKHQILSTKSVTKTPYYSRPLNKIELRNSSINCLYKIIEFLTFK